MTEKKRFVLRNEYFGGILHDVIKMNVETLSPKSYKLLRSLHTDKGRKRSTEMSKKDPVFSQLISRLIEKDGLKPNLEPKGIRSVRHPIELPKHSLASPIRVYDTYGYGCNLECQRCLNKSSREKLDKDRRTMKQTETIIEKFYDAGTMEWRLTGGEPTVYDNLLDTIAVAKDFGMSVMLNTNACWDDKLYDPLLNAGLTEIIVSIEGEEEVNDRLREQGVFRHIIRTLDAIKDHNTTNPDKGIRVTLNQTVSRENVHSVPYVVKLAAGYGYNINFVPTRPYGRASLDDLLTTREFMEFSKNVQELRDDPYVKESEIKVIHRNMDLFNQDMSDKSNLPYPFNYSSCGALSTGLGLSPDGKVNACSFLASDPNFTGLDLSHGGVTVYDAWLDPKIDRIRQADKAGCKKCEYYMLECEGKCIAMVLAEGGRIDEGKLLGRDRYCFAPLMK